MYLPIYFLLFLGIYYAFLFKALQIFKKHYVKIHIIIFGT